MRVAVKGLGIGLALVMLCASAAHADEAADAKKWGEAYAAGVKAFSAKEFAEAEKHLLAAYEVAKTFDGSDKRHRDTIEKLAQLWMTQREWAAAQEWLEKIVATDEFLHGEDGLAVAYSLEQLARNELMLKKYEAAEKHFERAMKLLIKGKGMGDPGVAALRNNLAEVFRRAGHLEKAIPLYQEALAEKEKAHGPGHAETASTLNDLGVLFNQLDQFARSEPILRKAVEAGKKRGEMDGVYGRCQHNLAVSLVGLKKYDEALPLYLAAAKIAKAQKPVDGPGLGNTLHNLGVLYQMTNKKEDAVQAYKEALKVRQLEFGRNSSKVKRTRKYLAELLDAMGKPGEAAEVRAGK